MLDHKINHIDRVRTAVFISGRGSNLSALLGSAKDLGFPSEISLVISNDPLAGGMHLAEQHGVPSRAFAMSDHGRSRRIQEDAIHACLLENRIELIALAGYMRILTPEFVERWQGRIMNIHPSLLPLYPGLHTHERALAAGDRWHGCTVHWVIPDLDAGETILQARVPVLQGDTPDLLAQRVLVEEHRIYPLALAVVSTRIISERGNDGRF